MGWAHQLQRAPIKLKLRCCHKGHSHYYAARPLSKQHSFQRHGTGTQVSAFLLNRCSGGSLPSWLHAGGESVTRYPKPEPYSLELFGKGLWETQLPGFTPEVGFLRSLDVARVRRGVGMSTPLHYTRQALSCSKGQKFATGFAVQRTHQVVKVELYVEGTSCAQAP